MFIAPIVSGGGGGGSGTVTSVGIANANSFSAMVANPTTTPLITLSSSYLNQSVKTTDSPTFAAITLGNTGLKVNDTDASHNLIIIPGSNLTANRNFNIITGDANRSLTLNGDPTLDNWFDQSVKQAASPTFAGVVTPSVGTSGATALDIKTNGTARINIASGGAIQFNGAYTFPTSNTAGALTNDGSGVLSWSAAGASTTPPPNNGNPSEFSSQYSPTIGDGTYVSYEFSSAVVLNGIKIYSDSISINTDWKTGIYTWARTGSVSQYSATTGSVTQTAAGVISIPFSSSISVSAGRYFFLVFKTAGNANIFYKANGINDNVFCFDGSSLLLSPPATETSRFTVGKTYWLGFY